MILRREDDLTKAPKGTIAAAPVAPATPPPATPAPPAAAETAQKTAGARSGPAGRA